MSNDELKALNEAIQTQALDPKLSAAPVVACINGPAVCIETIVRRACVESGLHMDWGYFGGRGFVQSKEDRKACRRALFAALPQSDLTQLDL